MSTGSYHFTAERKALYVKAYAETGELSAAASAVHISRDTVYKHLKKDPEFAAAVDAALGSLISKLMGTMKKLAIDGVEKITYDKDGNIAARTRTYDTRALLKWMGVLRKGDWGDKMQVNTHITGEVIHRALLPNEIPLDSRNKLRIALDSMPDEPDDDDQT